MAAKKNEMTYEAAIARLEEIVALLEKGGLPLDESVKLFEEGAGLSAFCDKTLREAQLRITELSAGSGTEAKA